MNPSIDNRPLGQAEATARGYNSADRLAVAYRKSQGLPAVITGAELEEDNASNYIMKYCRWGATRLIPHGFNEDLESDSDKRLAAVTIIGYIGKHLARLRMLFPDHPDWARLAPDEFPIWWTPMREAFMKECTLLHMLYVGDATIGGTDIHPLYSDLSAQEDKDDPLSQCHLKNIMISLIKGGYKGNGSVERAAQLYMTSDAIGRAGEVKFSSFMDWRFDPFLNVVDTTWSESKNINRYSMPRVPDKEWSKDFYWFVGAHALIEDGFYRTQAEKEQGKEHAVFPSLHSIQDKSVAKKLAGAIKDNLPKGLTEAQQSMYSAKSLRQAGITELSVVPDLTLFQATARTGHSTGTCLDSYLDKMNTAKGIPAANALHGNPLFARVVLPTLDAVGTGSHTKAQVEAFVGKLFVTSIDLLKPGGDLWRVVKTAAAALVWHFHQVTKDCGPDNVVTTALLECARDANISDPLLPGVVPELLLEEWSNRVDADMKQKSALSSAKASDSPLLGQMASMLSEVLSGVRELKEDKKAMAERLATQEGQIAALYSQNAHLQRKLSVFHTPPPRAPKRARLADDGDVAANGVRGEDIEMDDADTFLCALDAEEAGLQGGALLDGAPVPQFGAGAGEGFVPRQHAFKMPRRMHLNQTAGAVVDGNKGVQLMSVLVQMAESGHLAGPDAWSDNTHAKQYGGSDQQLLKNCLELVHFAAANEQQIEILANAKASGKDPATVRKAAEDLAKAAAGMLFAFEGTTAAEDAQQKKSKGTTWVGMGTRVRAYKKRIHDAKKSAKVDTAAYARSEQFLEYNTLEQFLGRRRTDGPDSRTGTKIPGRG